MMPRKSTWMFWATMLVGGFISTGRGQDKGAAPPAPEQIQFFETQVRPLLANNCFKCHGEKKQRGGLRLDSRAAILKGGMSGAAVIPGRPGDSRLIHAVNYQGDLEMPPTKKLRKNEIAALTEWVKMGLPWPGGGGAPIVAAPSQSLQVTDQDRQYWAFRPVQRPQLPPVKLAMNPIDAFIVHKLGARGLSLSSPASRRELIRRVYFDLLGLPPTPTEVEAFLRDNRPDAYELLIDNLLARPQYGERWGRHWLDVVRFAQTNGYERDDEKPHSWRYRDYVIKALNEDKPFNRFIVEQLAGDELDTVTDDSLTATAFYRLGVWDDEPDDKRQAEFDNLDDMLSVTATAFLGITLGCARCHDHKFDPIPQEDYYSMLAFLRNIKPHRVPGKDKDAEANLFAKLKSGGVTLAVRETLEPIRTHVLIRGSAASPGKEVSPRFVQVLCPSSTAAEPALPKLPAQTRSTGRRRALAEWIANPANPLTARVIANRLWHYHFGRGIVATPSDFGRTGTAPTHPELLDWLASELVAGEWRLKRMHKLILLSQTYQQSSRAQNQKSAGIDPGNTLLWRQNLRRLEAEAIRDNILVISGRLNLKMGGRGIFPTLSKEVLSTQSRPGLGWNTSPKEEQTRRSVYIFVKRTLGVPLLETFDLASPDTPTAARTTTTIAPQALILLNSTFMEEQADACAGRLMKEAGDEPPANIERLFRLALSRGPTPHEMQVALDYLHRLQTSQSHRRALAMLCKVVLNLNEMVYID
jgi:hypothetical protein